MTTSSSVQTTVPPTTVPPTTATTTTTTTTTTTEPPAPTTTAAPTTTTAPAPDVYDANCVVEVEVRGSLERLASGQGDEAVTGFDLWVENDFPGQAPAAGDLVDVCVDNRVNDVSGEPRIGSDDPIVSAAVFEDVKRQQEKLNGLFAAFDVAALDVDGVAGPVTRQRLCAARLALGLPTSTLSMQPGTAEYLTLFTSDSLPTPATTAIDSERWILIDNTCQMMFIGEGRDTTNVFPTSTGTEGFETRVQDRKSAFRFNPASDNGGWHNSSEYPVGVDNPLNGNMYKPLYFDLGQAIHGANSVPTAPASKGCARLRVEDQITLLNWLGLNEVSNPIWKASELQVTVNVQGQYISR